MTNRLATGYGHVHWEDDTGHVWHTSDPCRWAMDQTSTGDVRIATHPKRKHVLQVPGDVVGVRTMRPVAHLGNQRAYVGDWTSPFRALDTVILMMGEDMPEPEPDTVLLLSCGHGLTCPPDPTFDGGRQDCPRCGPGQTADDLITITGTIEP